MAGLAKDHWGKLIAGGGTAGLLSVLFVLLIQDYTQQNRDNDSRFQAIEQELKEQREKVLEAIQAHIAGPGHEPTITQIKFLLESGKVSQAQYSALGAKQDTMLIELKDFKQEMSRFQGVIEEAIRAIREDK